MVASVIRTARPRPPPIWREVFTSPEARPAWPCPAPWVAMIVEGTIERAIPAAVSSPGTMTYTTELPPVAIFVNSSKPTVIIIRPPPSTDRGPKRPTSFPALRATNMIASAIGRNVSPALSGERPSTCCR